ncbi:STAS-like domain-containing protein [Deltaproteobacteria bacterium TL4]
MYLILYNREERLLARFDRFKEIHLDFSGIDQIGQAFADEIFRVFVKEHPEIQLLPIETSDTLQRMIEKAQKGS